MNLCFCYTQLKCVGEDWLPVTLRYSGFAHAAITHECGHCIFKSSVSDFCNHCYVNETTTNAVPFIELPWTISDRFPLETPGTKTKILLRVWPRDGKYFRPEFGLIKSGAICVRWLHWLVSFRIRIKSCPEQWRGWRPSIRKLHYM